jgi:hypothetical protein
VLLIVVLIVSDAALWVAALTAPLNPKARFRAFAGASALLAVLCAQAIGWSWTSALAAVTVWFAAIVAGNAPDVSATQVRGATNDR